MSVSMEKLLEDAKLLVSRLNAHDKSADLIAEQTSSLQQEIDAHNAYQENLKDLNKAAGHRSRSSLIMGIQQENCAIRSLQRENNELCQMLKDQQNAMELIMTKYRQQILKFTQTESLHSTVRNQVQSHASIVNSSNDRIKVNNLVDKIYEMANVMHKAIEVDEVAFAKEHEQIAQLKSENQGLKELLLISKGSLGAKLIKTLSNTTEGNDFDDNISETVQSDS